MAQEFWTSQWVMSTTGVGSLAKGWVGGLASGAVLKNTFWGAIAGSGGGGWLGPSLGHRTATMYDDWKFGRLDQQFGNRVCAPYEIK
jgi:hypothetical protein